MSREILDKPTWRKLQRQRLRDSCPDQRAALASSLAKHLADWLLDHHCTTVLGYWPLPGEPDLRDLAAQLHSGGMRFALPRVTDDFSGLDLFLWHPGARMLPGAYGIAEPDPATWTAIEPAAIDAALIPALAFDPETGIRLGRGAGFYDRLLARPDFQATRIGIALPGHLATPLPADPHDMPMHFLATAGGMLTPQAPSSGTPESA